MTQNLLKLEGYDKTGQKTDWFTVLPAVTARDTDYTSQLFVARFAFGVMIEIILANEAGAAGFTPKILVPDAAGGSDVTVVSYSELTANGTYLLILYPGAGADMGNQHKDGTLPREWKLMMDYTTGTPATDTFDIQAYARYI